MCVSVDPVRAGVAAAAVLGAVAAVTGSWVPAAGAAACALAAFASTYRASTPVAAPPREIPVPPAPDASTVVVSLYEGARAECDAVSAHLWLEDPPTATARLVAATGPREPASTPVPLDDPVIGESIRTGAAVFRALMRLREDGVDTTVWRFAVPVATGQTRGAAAVDVRVSGAPPAEELTRVTSSLRGALAAALALHTAHAQTETARVLLDAARELSGRLHPDDVVARTLARAMQLSRAATGSVMLYDEELGALRIAAAKGLPAEVVREAVVREHEGIAGWVYSSGSPTLVEDSSGRPSSRRHGVRSAVSVPIADEHGILGVLNVGSRAFPARFTDDHMQSLESLGRQAAVSLRIARAASRSHDLYMSSLRALARALETKDPYSIGAAGRVSGLATALGARLGLDPVELQSVQVAAILHDIGMGMASGPVGASTRPLSTVDRGLLRAHPRVAADVLRDLPALEAVVPIVYHHHEHFDGHGYDGGLAGEEIPLGSRILAVADAFVAMVGERPYRPALSVSAALDELSAKSGSQFDPEVVAAFARLLQEDPDLALSDR